MCITDIYDSSNKFQNLPLSTGKTNSKQKEPQVLYQLPRWYSGKEFISLHEIQEKRARSLVGKIPWHSNWQPTPVFLPGKFHGQKNLWGYSPWSCKESNTTERTHTHTHTHTHTVLYNSLTFSKYFHYYKELMLLNRGIGEDS